MPSVIAPEQSPASIDSGTTGEMRGQSSLARCSTLTVRNRVERHAPHLFSLRTDQPMSWSALTPLSLHTVQQVRVRESVFGQSTIALKAWPSRRRRLRPDGPRSSRTTRTTTHRVSCEPLQVDRSVGSPWVRLEEYCPNIRSSCSAGEVTMWPRDRAQLTSPSLLG